MDQIIEAFGIDVRLIVIQLVNFGILMVALGYFLYKPVLRLLDERQQKIAQGIQDAEAAALAKASAEEEKRTVVGSAHTEAEAIMSRAKSHATAVSEEALVEARAKAEALIADAALQGNEVKARVLRESEAEVAKLAILAAEKILRERA